VGVLAFGLNLIQLQTEFQRLPLPTGSVVVLQDQQGRVLARSLDSEKFIGSTQPLAAPDEKDVRVDPDGIDRFLGVTSIERGPWTLSVGIPRSVVVSRLTSMYTRNFIILMGAILITLAMALWLSRHVSTDLDHLQAAARRIAQGDLSPPPRTPSLSLEVAALQGAFESMAASLREARTALARQIEQERKTGEMLQSIQRQMVRQERLAAVGVLASGVAHELNNPLQAILGTAEILERHPGLSADAFEEITLLKTQSGRARDIIRNLSRFASPQSEPPSLVDLREIIAEVVQLRRRELEKASISLDLEVSSTQRVYANATELEQVTLNFVINAQQSIESTGRKTGRILIRLYDAGRKVRLEVHDDGPGVSAEDEPKLFQPFFTTKPVGKGSGLGLSVSYGIIDSYGGTIGYHSNDWDGAVFYFELSAAETPEDSALLLN
jgi:C4-dicarboxylate-specific signal transduction histidine kinase